MTCLADMPDLLTTAEAKAVLRCGKNQLIRALNTGEVPGIRIGRSWRIPKHALERMITAAQSGNEKGPGGGEPSGPQALALDRATEERPAHE